MDDRGPSSGRQSPPAASRAVIPADLARLLDRRATRGAMDDQLLRALIDASPLAIWVLDLHGNVLLWNPSAERLTGWSPDEVLGRPLPNIPDEKREEFRTLFADVVNGGLLVDAELHRKRKDGTVVAWSLSAAPIKDENGRAVAVVGMAVDITQRQRAEASARQLAADQAAREAERVNAHDNARLFAEGRAAAERTIRLQALTAGLVRALSVEDVGEAVVREGMAAFQAANGVLCLTSADGRWLEIVHTVGLSEQTVRDFRRFPVDGPLPLSEAVRAGEPLLLGSKAVVQARYPSLREANQRAASESWIALPVMSDGTAIGGLTFGFTDARSFTDEDRALGIALAQQCAQALERTRLLAAERDARTEAERSADRTARLQRVTAALAATVTTDDVSQAMLDHGLAAVGAMAGVVCRLNDTATVIDRVWALGYPADGLEAFRKVALTVALPPRDVVQTRAPVFVESPAQWLERYLPPAPGMGIAPAAAGLPLLVGERLVGVMVLRFPEPRSFSPADQTQILSVASQCAQAMERARLHESERAARARADEANRAKTEFLAVMSHELRTPLNAIAGYAELLEIGVHGPLTDPQRDAIGRIQRSQRHLLGLINDVLNFARIDAGHIELDLSDVPVHGSLAALEALLAPQVRSKQLRYQYEPCDPALTAYADPEKVRQILLNLLSNAIKFTPAGGEVTLSCAADVQGVRIAVADSGSGVPADKLDRIFEPFVQLDAGRTRSHEGTGLGLAISRDLARAMHGEISVTSSVGVGSTFTLTLPRRGR